MSITYTPSNVPFQIYPEDASWLNHAMTMLRKTDIEWANGMTRIIDFLHQLNTTTILKLSKQFQKNVLNSDFISTIMLIHHRIFELLSLPEREILNLPTPLQIRLNIIKQLFHTSKILTNFKHFCSLMGLPTNFIQSTGGKLKKKTKKPKKKQMKGGTFTKKPQREQEYTEELGVSESKEPEEPEEPEDGGIPTMFFPHQRPPPQPREYHQASRVPEELELIEGVTKRYTLRDIHFNILREDEEGKDAWIDKVIPIIESHQYGTIDRAYDVLIELRQIGRFTDSQINNIISNNRENNDWKRRIKELYDNLRRTMGWINQDFDYVSVPLWLRLNLVNREIGNDEVREKLNKIFNSIGLDVYTLIRLSLTDG